VTTATATRRDLARTAIDQEIKRRRCARSFLAFLPFWQFVNRETGAVQSFADPWPGQRELAETYHEHPWVCALKAGKLGFTELECAYDGWVALFRQENARVHLFSRDGRASKELLGYVRFGLTHLPSWMRPEILEDVAGGDTTQSLKFSMGPDDIRTVVSYASGPHVSVDVSAQHAHVDELARMPFIEKTWNTVVSTVAPGGTCHIVSRGHGDTNYLATLWNAAVEGTSDLHPFFAPWEARPGRDQGWYAIQAGKMTPAELAYFAPATAEEALSADDMEVFIPIELWDACYDPTLERMPLDPDREGLAGSKTPVVISVDAASKHDCFGIVALTRHPERHDEVAVRGVRKWDPPKRKGGEIDYSEPEAFLRQLVGLFNVVQIAYDPYQLTAMMQALRRDTAVRCREFNQQKERLIADRGLYDLIVHRRISHDGNAMVREHMQNAAADMQTKDDSKLRIVKRAMDKRIDLVICISMGAKECLRLNI
jgi:hypothetical protein